jgi:hypothetical protein
VHTFSGVRLKGLGSQSLSATAGSATGNASVTVQRAGRSWASRLVGVLPWTSPLALVLVTPIVGAIRRRRRRRAAVTPEERILLAWTEVGEQLSFAGAPPRRADTPAEYAARAAVGADLHGEAARALTGLADQVIEVSYAPVGAAAEGASEAERRRRTIDAAVKIGRSRWRRAVTALDPRTLVDSGRR